MYTAPRLRSIETLQARRIFDTALNPIAVRAEDKQYYVTKPQTSPTDRSVVREFIGAHFLKIWDLPVPDFAIIDVQPHHIPSGLHGRLTKHEFSRPAFGSLYLEGADYVTEALAQSGTYQINKTSASEPLTRLSLFDLWLSNNDRNWNNHNLLYRFPPNPAFIPIDHERLFDHGVPGEPMFLQTDNENLSGSVVFQSFVSVTYLRTYARDPASRDAFLGLVDKCQASLGRIVSEMPEEWGSLCTGLIGDSQQTIFAPDWLDKVWKAHLEQLHNNRK